MHKFVFSLLFLLPADARSCATCFGAGDNEGLIKGFYIGGAILLACVFSILGTLAYYIRNSEKRKTAAFAKMGLMAEGEKTQERWPL